MEEVKKIKQLILKAIRDGMHMGRDEKDPYTIHASSIYSFCPYRCKLALEANTGYAPPEPIDSARALTFKIGRKIQDIVVESLLNTYPNYTLSLWYCENCNTSKIEIGNRCRCNECGNFMEQREITLEYTIGRTGFVISGSIDLFFGINQFYPIEIKSVRKEDFEKDRAIYKYLYQLSVYLWLIKNTPMIYENMSHELGLLLYVSKVHKSPPIRMFAIKPLPEVNREMAWVIKQMKTFSKTGKAEKICKQYNSPTAKQCPFKEQCWK